LALCCQLLKPSRSGFRLTLWRWQVTRLFQQFSRFRLGKELGQTQHHFLKQDKVGQSGNILEPLALELGEPGEGLREAEEPVLFTLLLIAPEARRGT
jgi:hypothetical protein